MVGRRLKEEGGGGLYDKANSVLLRINVYAHFVVILCSRRGKKFN